MVDRSIDFISSDPAYSAGVRPIALDDLFVMAQPIAAPTLPVVLQVIDPKVSTTELLLSRMAPGAPMMPPGNLMKLEAAIDPKASSTELELSRMAPAGIPMPPNSIDSLSIIKPSGT